MTVTLFTVKVALRCGLLDQYCSSATFTQFVLFPAVLAQLCCFLAGELFPFWIVYYATCKNGKFCCWTGTMNLVSVYTISYYILSSLVTANVVLLC